ncbi:MAG: class I SAM-dependent methyltransferase [Candidatus Bathycorpusculaceae bacterium]
MRNIKAEMFNRKASNPKNKPDETLEALALQQGQMVADIGAGGGYFSLRFAEAVGKNGQVFAVDTNPNFLEFVKNSAKEKGLDNVETILIAADNPTLPEKKYRLNIYAKRDPPSIKQSGILQEIERCIETKWKSCHNRV